MKRKYQAILIIVSLCIIALIILNFFFVNFGHSFKDKYQGQFLINSGFLVFDNDDKSPSAISNYAKAIRILHEQKIDKVDFDNLPETYDLEEEVAPNLLREISELVLSSAKMKKLGSFSVKNIGFSISVQGYGDIEILDIILLSKVIANIAQQNLIKNKDLDRVVLLAKADIAMGVQFSEHRNKMVHLLGISCKEKGLK